MSDPFIRYTFMNDKFDRTTFSPDGSEYNSNSHIPGQTTYFHPGYEQSLTTGPITQGLRGSVSSQNEWVMSAPPYRPTPTALFVSPPPFLPPTLRASTQIPLNTSSAPSPHSGPSTNFIPSPFLQDPTSVAMPIPSNNTQHSGGGLMDAHVCHYDPSLNYAHRDDYVVEHTSSTASSFIPPPIVPMFPGASPSNYMDPFLRSDPTRQRSPGRPTTAFENLSPSNYTFTPSGSSDSESVSFSSQSSPFSRAGSHSLPVSPSSDSDVQDLIQPQSIMTGQSFEQTLTVPSTAVEFPHSSTLVFKETSFFQCRWGNCGIWITSDKDAIKDHLLRVHDVVLKGASTSDSARCEWAGCSSTPQRSGLVRHFHTHLGLKWLCSVCRVAYTRHDSVGYHARREPRCEFAQAISHPSAVAYRARVNRDHTVTLTKILRS